MKTIIAATVAAFSINAHAFFGVSDEVAHCVDLRNNVGINAMELGERTKCYAEAQGKTSGVRGNFVWVRAGDKYTYIPMQEIREAGSREAVQQVITREVVNNVVVEQLEADIEALETEIDSLNTQIDTLAPLAEMVPSLQDQIADLMADVSTKQTRIADLLTAQAGLTGDISRLEGELATANADLTTAQAEVTRLEGEVERIQDLLDTANGRISTLETDLAATESALATQRQITLDNIAIVDGYTSRIAAAEAIINNANYDYSTRVGYSNTHVDGSVQNPNEEFTYYTVNGNRVTEVDGQWYWLNDDDTLGSLDQNSNNWITNGIADGTYLPTTVEVNSYTADTLTGTTVQGVRPSTEDLNTNVFTVVTPSQQVLDEVASGARPPSFAVSTYYVGSVNVGQAAYNIVLTAVNSAIQEAADAAYNAGYADGYDDGYDAGYADGYADGFEDGVNSVQ